MSEVGRSFDVIVVGLGAVGSSTLYQLAKRGVRCLGVDRFMPPHDHGSSHGETRITRQAIGEGLDYSPLAIRSHAIWRELEAETGQALLLECGFVSIDGAPGGGRFHGKEDFFGTMVESAERHTIKHDLLDSAELRYRFPQFQPAGHERAYYEPGGGLVFPERCIGAQLKCAQALGAQIIGNRPVLDLTQTGSEVMVRTMDETFHAARVILTAGGWTPGFVKSKLSAMRLLRQELHWFEAEDLSAFAPGRFPSFIWTYGSDAEESFYGFPATPGLTPGVKLAAEQYQTTMATPEALDRPVASESAALMYKECVAGRIAGLPGPALRSVACFYTQAPDSDFVLAIDPDDDRLAIVSACSGHGFKHSAGLGELIVDHVVGGAEVPSAFALDRPALSY